MTGVQTCALPISVALFYYAGHGVQINGQNYLIPLHEAFETPDDIITDALSLNTVQTAFDDAKVSVDIFILDACRDNPFAKKNSRSLNGTRGLTVVNKSASVEGTAVMFSTAPGETAADGTGRNGTFTQVLLKYLDSDLKLQDLATKVTKDVKTLTGGKQTPYNSLSLSDDFYLVPASMRKTLTPSSSASSNISGAQVALLGQRSALVAKRKTLLSGPSPLGWLTWAGLAGSAAGVGASVWGYLSVQQAKAAYATATGLTDLTARQLGWDAARATKDLGNILFSGGIALAVGGLGALVVPFFTGPDTASIDQKIAEIDRTMAGANQ